MDSFFIDHIKDLSKRSEDKCIFTFSNFLNGEEINELNIHRSSLTHFELFGGADGTERQMARFGDENELYYSEDFPIDCIKIEPLSIKFAEALSHRDILGSIMNLSIEREHIGDIVEGIVFETENHIKASGFKVAVNCNNRMPFPCQRHCKVCGDRGLSHAALE